MAKAITFTARKFDAATAGFVVACTAIDKSVADNAKAINAWAGMAAAGIASGAITLDTVKEGLIARFPKAVALADCGNTVKSRFYSLARCVKGGNGERLANGEALNTVARETAPVQEQAKGKRGNKPAKGKASKGITLSAACSALGGWLDTALGDIEAARELARNPDLALITAKLGKLAAMVSAPAKAGKRQPGRVKESMVSRGGSRGIRPAARKAA